MSRTSFCRQLATVVRCSPCARLGNWPEECDGADLLGGVCAGQRERCAGYDVAGMLQFFFRSIDDFGRLTR
jgi:hypothetical protein